MISRIGLIISRIFEKCAPDPFVIAVLLSLLTAVLGLAFGKYPDADASLLDRGETLLSAWSDSQNGIWKLLGFSMQMCLILVTGHALAVTAPVRRMIHAVARLPRSTASAAAMVSFIACATALINWGLGLIVGALLAREVGRSMQQRGIPAHYPLIVAAGYMGLMIWHGGLSGSAPLSMTTAPSAAKVLPAAYVAALGDTGVPLSQTLFSPMNLFITLGLLIIVPIMFSVLAPKRVEDLRPATTIDVETPISQMKSEPTPSNVPDWLDRSPIVVWTLAIALGLGLWSFTREAGLGQAGLNEVNAAMLALGLVLHGSARSYMAAAEDGARGCAGIIIQFPLYAGIMAMMVASGLVERIAEAFTAYGNQSTIPAMSFFAASIINLFVPSGGGQWAVQGPIALEAGLAAGIEPGKMIMSVAYGDQLTNMLQPFWALPLLAITGAKARDIVGYTATVMLIAAVWITLGLLLF